VSASPLYRLHFHSGPAADLRGNAAVQRRTSQGYVSNCLARDVRPGDEISWGDWHWPGRIVTSVERLPPRHAGGGGRKRAD
jgi:hypothetical protein